MDAGAPDAGEERARTLPLPLALLVERAIETVLRLDPDTRERLARLEGRVVRVRTTRRSSAAASSAAADVESGEYGLPPFELALSVVDARVNVLRAFDGQADVSISGSLPALRSLVDGNDALYSGEVKIEGDVGVAQSLRDIVGALHVDPEEVLEPFLGGALARRVGLAGRDLLAWVGRTRESARANAEEYLKEESGLLPAAEEIRHWSDAVDDARAATDRLEARLLRLERRSDRDRADGEAAEEGWTKGASDGRDDT